MNHFRLKAKVQAATVSKDYLRAVAFGFIFGKDQTFDLDGDDVALEFFLPFSLDNLDIAAAEVLENVIDTKFRSVNEFSDRPYPAKGLLCVVESTGTDWKKDFDNWTAWQISKNNTATAVKTTIAVGYLNSTKSEVYTPVEGENAVFYANPAMGQRYKSKSGGTTMGGTGSSHDNPTFTSKGK